MLAVVWFAFVGSLPLIQEWPPSPLTRWHVVAAWRQLFLIHPELVAGLARTLFVALVVAALALLLGALAGYALSRKPSARLEVPLAAGRLLPGLFWALGLALPLMSIGLYDRPEGLVLVYSAPATILVAWVTRRLLDDLPAHWGESLLTLGWSPWRVWNAWTWDWLRPRLARLAVLVMLGIWNEAAIALILTQYRPTLSALLVRLTRLVMLEAGAGGPPGMTPPVLIPPGAALAQLGAAATLLALPPLCALLFLGRPWLDFWLGVKEPSMSAAGALGQPPAHRLVSTTSSQGEA